MQFDENRYKYIKEILFVCVVRAKINDNFFWIERIKICNDF